MIKTYKGIRYHVGKKYKKIYHKAVRRRAHK